MDSRNHFCSVSHCWSMVTPGLGPVGCPFTIRGRELVYSGMVPAQAAQDTSAGAGTGGGQGQAEDGSAGAGMDGAEGQFKGTGVQTVAGLRRSRFCRGAKAAPCTAGE